MNLTELKQDFEALINNISGIKTFVYDDLSSMNIDRDKDYPVFLLKPITNSKLKTITEPYKHHRIDFFLFELFPQNAYRTLTGIWDDLEAKLDVFVGILYGSPEKYIIEGEIDVERGHFQHNDKLAGVRYQFELKVFDCRE